jgi:hypothetical protein
MTATVQRLPRDLPAPTSAANMAKRLALVLASQVGYREGRSSSGDWNNDNAYGAFFGQNGVSWCNWFQSWGAFCAEIPASVIPHTGYTPASWNWFVDHNRDVKTPQAGDLFWVYGYVASEGQSRVHHIGFVEKVLSGGRIQTLEGNTNTSGSTQGNGVYRLTRTVSSKLRFARPNYAAAVPVAKPPVKPTPPPAKPVKPIVPEDNMPDINEVRTVVADELNKQDRDLWAAPTGTGTHFIADTKAGFAALNAQVAGLTAAVKALAESQNVDPDAIIAAVTEATDKAMADLKITLSVDPAPEA